jgi:hypothetical protein
MASFFYEATYIVKNMRYLLIISSALFLSSCNNKEKTGQQVKEARQMTLDSVHEANRRQYIMDSITAVSSASPDALVIESPTLLPAPEVKKNSKKPPVKTQPAVPANTGVDTKTPSTNPPVAGGDGTSASTGTLTEEQKKKKGLNNAAKGAIIGLGTGAAAGAVLNKDNRGKGAVIGGVVGAVGGAVGGAVLDKRKAKKESQKDSTSKKEK